MQLSQLNIPPELTTPQEREKFFRHVLQDSEPPLEARVEALQALITLIEQEAYEAGRHSGEIARDRKRSAASEVPMMYRAVRAAWNDLERDGQLLCGPRGTARLLKDEQLMAMFVAIVVRNALESFHVDNIPNTVMKEFNTIVRDAIYTALRAAGSMDSEQAFSWAASQLIRVPPYWERPRLLASYTKSVTDKPRRKA